MCDPEFAASILYHQCHDSVKVPQKCRLYHNYHKADGEFIKTGSQHLVCIWYNDDAEYLHVDNFVEVDKRVFGKVVFANGYMLKVIDEKNKHCLKVAGKLLVSVEEISNVVSIVCDPTSKVKKIDRYIIEWINSHSYALDTLFGTIGSGFYQGLRMNQGSIKADFSIMHSMSDPKIHKWKFTGGLCQGLIKIGQNQVKSSLIFACWICCVSEWKVKVTAHWLCILSDIIIRWSFIKWNLFQKKKNEKS